MRTTRMRAAVALIAAVTLSLSACGASDDSGGGGGSSDTPKLSTTLVSTRW